MPTWNTPEARDRVIRTLIGEAAAGDQQSLISVAHVIKNRADSGHYGDKNASSTVLAPLQFSMWNKGMASSGKTISPNDPRYQQAGQIADAVFGGQVPDNTGGADHYYAPSGMPGGQAPSWAVGKAPTATIGGQHFYKLGLSASDAITGGGGSSGGGGGSPLAPLGAAGGAQAAGAVGRALADAHKLLGKNEVPDHDMLVDYLKTGGQNLDPRQSAWRASFVSASLQREGLPVPGKIVKDSAFGGGANARDYLTYGQGVTDPGQVQAGDILVAKDGSHVGFAEGPVRQGANGPEVQILAGNEADRSGKYQPGSWTNPQTGQVANRSQVGQVAERWAPLADFTVRRAPAGTPDAGPASSTAPAAAASAPIPTSAAQPASATAPGSSGGNFAVPPAGAYPGSDKYSVIQGMTSGTSHNPQLTTAANWGNLFGGGGAPAPPPAPPAAATPSQQPASAPDRQPSITDVPINRNNPLPWQGPPQGPPMPPPAPVAPPTLPSLSVNWGAGTPTDDTTIPDAANNRVPGAGVTGITPMTKGAPSMGFPAMTNPFGNPPPPPPDQNASLPGSMFASAQNLLKLLFPTA